MKSGETTAIRAGEELNTAALREYLRGKVEGFDGSLMVDSLAVEQFPGGHSNLTYLLKAGDREYVLRRAPLGPVAPKAHDMVREYRVLHAVHPHFAETPAVYHLCQDPAVLGAPFFLMERRRGVILRDRVPDALAAVPHFPERVSEGFVDCLVRLHAIDVSQEPLRSLGKPEGYVERQVRGWAERWNRAKTEDLPEMDRVVEWLGARVPRSTETTLIHNDYKLDNLMLSVEQLSVAQLSVEQAWPIEAVLDWEMATIGDPLSDLGLTLCYWSWANAPQPEGGETASITAQPGWYTRDQFVNRYAERTGRDLTHLGYYEVLGVFKLAVIIQQIYQRFHCGQTQDERFRHFDQRTRGLVRLAAALVGQVVNLRRIGDPPAPRTESG
ncbi:MAG TPA: phosphotransferase family protein [Candidatus Acidoferrales bacterium]|nr:phosphotransferase family protein [Candidatus Acidoferrales bacterium]